MAKKSRLAGMLAIAQGNPLNEIALIDAEIIDPFHNHPFKVRDDERMAALIESIRETGIQDPLQVREKAEGRYELIAGHRRLEAAKRSGIEKVPVIIRNVDDELATIMMVDSNFSQREEILPSEKAFAYKMKFDALKKSVGRPAKQLSHCETISKKRTDEIIAEEEGISRANLQRYIRLTELIPELLEKVDNGTLGFIPAVDISYLDTEQQSYIEDVMNIGKVKPTKTQAAEIKAKAQEKKLTKKAIQEILTVEKEEKFSTWKVESKQFKKYLPPHLQKKITARQADEILAEAMRDWAEKHKNDFVE